MLMRFAGILGVEISDFFVGIEEMPTVTPSARRSRLDTEIIVLLSQVRDDLVKKGIRTVLQAIAGIESRGRSPDTTGKAPDTD